MTFISTDNVEPDFRSGVEVRFGSTFSIGGCDSCGSGYGYGGGAAVCGCNSCASCNVTNYAWEVAWWGLDHDVNDYTRTEDLPSTTHMYGTQNFNGAEYEQEQHRHLAASERLLQLPNADQHFAAVRSQY